MRAHTVLLPVAVVLFGLTACTAAPTAAPAPSASTIAAAPSAAPSSAVPSSAPPSSTGPSAPTPATGPGTPKPDRELACPSARTLETLHDLGKGQYYPPSGVKCWKTWAWAKPEGTDVGDGIDLFRYRESTGWRYHSSGSALECKELGINEKAPFCG